MPPTSVPNESGISSLDGETLDSRPTWTAAGSSTAPAAMLFITSENAAPAVMNSTIRRTSEPAPTRRSRRAIHVTTPVSSSAWVIMNRPMIVITTERLKPENASSESMIPVTGSVTSTRIATRSGRTCPDAIAISAAAIIPTRSHPCVLSMLLFISPGRLYH